MGATAHCQECNWSDDDIATDLRCDLCGYFEDDCECDDQDQMTECCPECASDDLEFLDVNDEVQA